MSESTALWDIVDLLIDEEIGIIGKLMSLPRQNDMPNFFYYKALLANTGIYDGPENFSVSGGTSTQREKAMVKAIGEGIERYSSAVYHYDTLKFGSLKTLNNCLDPDAFKGCYSPANLYASEDAIHWSTATRLSDHGEILVPSALVYCPYEAKTELKEKEIAEQISTGLAAHTSRHAAVLNGLMEVVERDAFMLHWMSGSSVPEIEQSSTTALHKELLARLAYCGYQVRLFNITSDNGIPSIMGVMRGTRSTNVPVMFSAATHLSSAMALSKCIEELALIERYAKRLISEGSSVARYEDPKEVNRLIDHLSYWLDPARSSIIDKMTATEKRISLKDMPELAINNPEKDLETAATLVQNTGCEVYVADCTAEDIAALDLHCVRVIVPSYLPLNKRHDQRPKDAERLQKVLERSGSSINDHPHPFA